MTRFNLAVYRSCTLMRKVLCLLPPLLILGASLSWAQHNSLSERPAEGQSSQPPYEITVSTIPRSVYKENDGIYGPDVTETFIFSVVVKESHSRAVEPSGARLEFYSAGEVVNVVEFSGRQLKAIRSVSARRFQEEEVFDLRHHFSVPVALDVDRLVYRLSLAQPTGAEIRQTLEIPLMRYQQRARLLFPLRGRFLIVQGHDFNEPHSRGWSQQFAYDIVSVGPNFEIARNNGRANQDFFTWGQEVLTPADGTVVYARNDVPDNRAPGTIDRDAFMRLPDPMNAIPGNNVLIDHGNGEYSSLAHLQRGSVSVKAGDRVRQGEVIGRLGNSGSSDTPHLHYQLMAGTHLARSDGLPSRFENVWMESFTLERMRISMPRRGMYLEAR